MFQKLIQVFVQSAGRNLIQCDELNGENLEIEIKQEGNKKQIKIKRENCC